MEKTRKNGTKYLLLGGSLFLLAALALLGAARRVPGFADWYVLHIYPVLVGTVGRFFGLFPFSVVELGLYAGAAALVFLLIRFFKQPLFVLSVLFLAASALLFSYAAGCGVNYYRQPFSYYLTWEGETVENSGLEALCTWLTGQVNLAYEKKNAGEPDGQALADKGIRAMERLAEQYPQLAGYYPRPKPVLFSWILSVQQYSGVYSPFTIEANYNRDMVSYNIPHTICHEMSHLRGFMREDEANFIGYLACLGSEDADFCYSGYLMGWIYAGNALARENFEKYAELYGQLADGIKEELRENNQFWDQYEGRAAEAAAKVNDTYLKVNGQSEGVKTYGRVVDLMILDFLKNREDNACIGNGKMVE